MLDLIVEPGCFFYILVSLFGRILFNQDMDITHPPDETKFTATADGAPMPILDAAWFGARDLDFSLQPPNGPPTTICITYNGGDPLFKTARGKVVKPFGPVCMQACPSALDAATIAAVLKNFGMTP